tara:strand:- start:908 stop:1243 length:336 start_codon:yes stop_codon:yes gene_type:complete
LRQDRWNRDRDDRREGEATGSHQLAVALKDRNQRCDRDHQPRSIADQRGLRQIKPQTEDHDGDPALGSRVSQIVPILAMPKPKDVVNCRIAPASPAAAASSAFPRIEIKTS